MYVYSAWSRLQLLVEDREALVRKAIQYHKTTTEVNEVLDGLEKDWLVPDHDLFLRGSLLCNTHTYVIRTIYRVTVGKSCN